MISREQFQDMVRRLPEVRPSDYVYRRDMHFDRHYGARARPFDYIFEATHVFAPPRAFARPDHFEPESYRTRVRFHYGEDFIDGAPVGFWRYGELMVKVFPL